MSLDKVLDLMKAMESKRAELEEAGIALTCAEDWLDALIDIVIESLGVKNPENKDLIVELLCGVANSTLNKEDVRAALTKINTNRKNVLLLADTEEETADEVILNG
ncbi:hypothetical protein IHV09_22120 [Fictibacillus sp. 23RED33]|uniref:hypothetical protein n=1 Tax=Fictibacillus sp. 23RED33 TaxID=2745879 RepID=UPI0018CDE3C6|nr:hypothetical protein [Fictibacillus sp. 23RED33]MBH0176257.1 hypothetical protein [Fictibacillus sp. 23RED33]